MGSSADLAPPGPASVDPERGRLRKLVLALSVCAALASAWQFLGEMRSGIFAPDFTVFWTAAQRPDLAYDVQALTAAQAHLTSAPGLRPFPYPPTFLLLLRPLGLLPYPLAFAGWIALGLIVLGWVARRRLTWTETLLAVSASPCLYAAASGQSSLLLGAGVVWALLSAERRPGLAGAILGAVLVIKPQLAVLAPLALIRSPRGMVMFALAAVALVAASAAAFGIAAWRDWLQSLPLFSHIAMANRFIPPRNLNPAGALAAAGAPAAILLHIASALAGAALALLSLRRGLPTEMRAAALIVGSFLVAPYVMPYDASLLAPLGMLLLREGLLVAGAPLLVPAYAPWFGAGCLAAFAGGLFARVVHFPASSREHP